MDPSGHTAKSATLDGSLPSSSSDSSTARAYDAAMSDGAVLTNPAPCEQTPMTHKPPHTAVEQLFESIVKHFSAGDLDEYFKLFDMPCLLVTDQGNVAVTSMQTLQALFDPMMARLKADGYKRSAYSELSTHWLSPTLAIASMVWKRYRADDSLLETQGVTYTLRRTDGAWRMVVLQPHEPATAIQFH